MRGLYKCIGVQSRLSTAYHPQTDGESERYNQELEQFLRVFCNYRQNDWVKWLPYAEISHNSRVHAATGKAPFELLHGFLPRLLPTVTPNPLSKVPSIEEHLKHLNEIREELKASLTMAAELMKRQNGDHMKDWTPFKIGDKVLLDGKNLRTTRPKAKLANKRHGPFEITDVIGTVNYRLKLPSTWKIHPVFHASLLKPYRETEAHGPNYPGVPDELLPDNEEYDVEAILDSRRPRNGRGVEYLVKWLDYSDADNQWLPSRELGNVTDMIQKFHEDHPTAYHPLKPHTVKKRRARIRSLGITMGDIWKSTTVLQAQAPPREGVLLRTASILLRPTCTSGPRT